MPGLLETCRDLFGTDNLYEVLGVPKEATPNEIKRGYYRHSVTVHPKRVPNEEAEAATKKFQTLGKVCYILSQQETHRLYDETGQVDDEKHVPQNQKWYKNWKLLYKNLSVKSIQRFEKKYKGSDEEWSDVAATYLECKGDMDRILQKVLFATLEDEARFINIVKLLIKNREVPDFKAFNGGKKKEASTQKEAGEKVAGAEATLKEMGVDASNSLKSPTSEKTESKEHEADNSTAKLEEEYAPKTKVKKWENHAEEEAAEVEADLKEMDVDETDSLKSLAEKTESREEDADGSSAKLEEEYTPTAKVKNVENDAEEKAVKAEATLKEMRVDESDSVNSLTSEKNESREQEAANASAQVNEEYAPKPKVHKVENYTEEAALKEMVVDESDSLKSLSLEKNESVEQGVDNSSTQLGEENAPKPKLQKVENYQAEESSVEAEAASKDMGVDESDSLKGLTEKNISREQGADNSSAELEEECPKPKVEMETVKAEAALQEMGVGESDSIKGLTLKNNISRGQEANNSFVQLEEECAPKAKRKKVENDL